MYRSALRTHTPTYLDHLSECAFAHDAQDLVCTGDTARKYMGAGGRASADEREYCGEHSPSQ